MLQLEAQHEGPVRLDAKRRVLDERLAVGTGQDEALIRVAQRIESCMRSLRIDVVAHRAEQRPVVGQLEAEVELHFLLRRCRTHAADRPPCRYRRSASVNGPNGR